MTEVYNKNGIPFDIDAIATDLNGKADCDLINVNDSGTSLGASWSMPSGTYTDLTLGASGTTYTAPANGWVTVSMRMATANDMNIQLSSGLRVNNRTNGSSQYQSCTVPCLKGETITISYSGSISDTRLRFIYAEGSKGEA